MQRIFIVCVNIKKKKYKNKIKITIITLIDKGYYEPDLKKLGINVVSLKINKQKKIFLIKKLIKFRRIFNNKKPDVIQSWMYHSNFLTLLLPIKFYNIIYWNIRHSELNTKISKKMTITISLICGLLSKIIPKKIIYCSERSQFFHEKFHFYSKGKSSLIENGFSFKTYYPSKKLRINFEKK